jgi:class 3 adenylate cyclase/tetratricopeptide (TPR) repeat protein
LRRLTIPRPSGRPLPAPELLDLVVEVAGEAAQLEQRLGEHAPDRGQLARPGRLPGRHHLRQGTRGGQLLAPELLLVFRRVPPSLRCHDPHPSLRLAPRQQRYGHSVATPTAVEYPICRRGEPLHHLSRIGLSVGRIVHILDVMATCPSCGNGITQPINFCPQCGTRLGAAPPSEEYKIVTVVFCDVVKSTGMGRRLGRLPMQRLMDRYGETVRRVLGRHGASIGKRHGDGFMAAFGIPELREDDALRAVRAAGELRAALAELAAELRRDRGVDLNIRLGVNTGSVLVRDAGTIEEEVTGDAVNLAKYFEEAAGTDQILIGDQTYRLVADAVRAEPAGSLAVNGLPEPQQVWRLLEVLPDRPGRIRRLDAPMVGRGVEMDLLLRVFERVVAEQSCHLVTVLGSGGVGKSRLADEFVAGLGERAIVVRAHCLAFGDSVTVWPMVEIVRQAAGITSADPPSTARARLAELAAGEERGELLIERVAQMLGIGLEAGLPEDTLWAVQRLLGILASRRPLVVVIDDLQWADSILLDAVEHLTEQSRDTPIMLLCIARPEELFPRRGQWPGGKVNTLSFLLSPLGEREGEQLVGHLLGGRVDPAAQAHISGWAQGFPLIVEELVANLRDEGRLLPAGDRWVLRREPDGDRRERPGAGGDEETGERHGPSVPTSIQALLLARLERLDARGRAILEPAAVVGEQFHFGDVQALSGGSSADVDEGLRELVRLDLIRPDHGPASVPLPSGSGDGYRFRHTMIQAVAYERMPDDRRAELHGRYADWLERQTADRPSQFDEMIGHHFHQAFRYATKLEPGGDRTLEFARRAGERYAAAGQRAAIRGDTRLVQAWLGRAVRLLPADHPVRLRALPPLAEAFQVSGRLNEAARAYQELTRSATAAGDDGLATHASIGRLRLMALHEPERFLREGRDQIELAMPVFERLGDRLGLAKAWHLLAYLDWTRGRLTLAGTAAERARGFAREADDPYWEATILGLHCLILYWGPTPLEEVAGRNREALAEAERSGMRSLEATALTVLARVAALQGNLEEARQLLRSATAITVDLGESLTQATDCISLALIEVLDGDLAAAEDTLRDGYRQLEQMGGTGPRATVTAMLARVLLLRGRSEEAEESTRTCERIAAADQLDAQVKWRSIRAIVLARRGEPEEAERWAREAVYMADKTDQLDSRAEAHVDLAEVLRLGGRRGESARELERAVSLYREKGNEAGERNARRLLASIPR